MALYPAVLALMHVKDRHRFRGLSPAFNNHFGVLMNQVRKVGGARRVGLLLAAAAALSFTQAASAGVTPGDTFTFSIAAFNSAGTSGFILGSGFSAVFGSTTTFAAAGYNGQAYTISSSEVVGATTTTDFFKISTPVNFLTTAQVNGVTMSALQLDIGTANSGVGVATGADTVSFTGPIASYTAAGNVVYGTGNTVFNLTPNVTLTNGTMTLTAAEGVNVGTSAISGIAIHEFDFSITYANAVPVPEASTGAMLLAGLGLMGGVVLRRSRKGRGA